MWALFYGPLTNNFICYSFESTYMNAFGYVWFLSFICTVLSIRIVIFAYIPMSRYQREVIRIRKSKKDRLHNGQRKKYKRTNNDLQSIHIKQKIEQHECFSGCVSSIRSVIVSLRFVFYPWHLHFIFHRWCVR